MNLELLLFLGELGLETFHQALHGVAGRADVGFLLGLQLAPEVLQLLLCLGGLGPQLLTVPRQRLQLDRMPLLQPGESISSVHSC